MVFFMMADEKSEKPAADESELSEADLDQVSGGVFEREGKKPENIKPLKPGSLHHT
jgi:hypothetical protein